MRKCIIISTLIISPIVAHAKSEIMYGYDKLHHEIYAQTKDKKATLQFQEDYTGNPSYSFDFFSGVPAIIVNGQSLHDSTVYATLNYNHEFKIDCLYFDIKSKKNGVMLREGTCGLNITLSDNYADYIEQKLNKMEDVIDSIDTSLILNDRMNHLSIIILKSKHQLVYKLYKSKEEILQDKYSVLTETNNGECKVYSNNPWIIYDKNEDQQIEIMAQRIVNAKIELNKATQKDSTNNECVLYPPISVKQPKAFFYDSSFKLTKSYLIKNDKVNLLSISADSKWCKIQYINEKNISTYSNMLCSGLSI